MLIFGLILTGCNQQGLVSNTQNKPGISDNQTTVDLTEKQDASSSNQTSKIEEQGKSVRNPSTTSPGQSEFDINKIKVVPLPTKKMNAEALTVIEVPYKDMFISDMYIEENKIYMAVHENSLESPGRIIEYDIKSKAEKLLFESPMKVSYQSLMVNKDWILWRDSGNNMSMNKFYVRNRNTGEDKVIYDNEESIFVVPYLYNNYVAWVDAASSSVMLYNLETDNIRNLGKINELSFYNSFANISDDVVLWTDSIEGKGYYILYDINTEKITKYEVPFRYPGYAALMNGKIYSINFQNDYHTFSDNRFGIFDLATMSYKQLTQSDITDFKLSKKSVAFLGGGCNFRLCVDHSNLTEISDVLLVKTVTGIYYSEDGRVIAKQLMPDDSNNTILYIIDPNKI